MKMTSISPPGQGLTTITLEHQGMTLNWDVSSTYARTQSKLEEDIDVMTVFEEINAYWATMSPERQTAIFETYKDIHSTFIGDYDVELAVPKLRQKVSTLYNYHPLSELQHWLQFHGNVGFPASVKERNDDPNMRQPDRTYLRSDYFGLVSLAVAFRPMIPIWGMYISRRRRELGNNYKEREAFRLMYNTMIAQCPEIERLHAFIASYTAPIAASDKSLTAVMSGSSTTELAATLMAMACVRRLAVLSVSGNPEVNNLIAKLHFFVNNKINSLDRDMGRPFGGRISEKKQTSGSGEESNISVAEMYKMKPDISDGDIMSITVYAEDPYRMAAARAPDLPLELLDQCLENCRKIQPEDIGENQIWLARWICDPVIPAEAMELLTFEPLLNCLALTQAVLWHWGFYDLAVIVTATPLAAEEDVVIGATEGRSRILKEDLLRLQQAYPYELPVKKNTSARQSNVAARGVDRLAELLTRNDWIVNAPQVLVSKSTSPPGSGFLTAPADLKIQLCKLLFHPNFKIKKTATVSNP
ncbi:hypothetical protein LUCX_73 [Xanthomonas phage vB_XciM_LucasX]|nr:hypothetical protein LUCX_73 [Xanthomonas phage vB_XciM_LucasX]